MYFRSLPFNELVKRAGTDKQTEYFISDVRYLYIKGDVLLYMWIHYYS